MIKINSKIETLNILINYFNKFDLDELHYYLEKHNNEKIPQFLESNIYDPKEIELINLVIDYLNVSIEKIFYISTPLNYKKSPIKISFVSNSIYWEEIFVIQDTIFMSYIYLVKIFLKIENKKYLSLDDIYIENNKIYDLNLLKKLSESIYFIIQFHNLDNWKNYIHKKYSCIFIDKYLIKFTNKYNILKDPNTSFLNDKIILYSYKNEQYAIINLVSSNISFSPYWEQKILKLEYINGYYIEIAEINNNLINDLNFVSNPFISKSKELTNCVIHN